MATEEVVVRIHGPEEGGDGDVALGYPLIDDGSRRTPPAAVVGYPLPPAEEEPRPPSTSATGQPARDSCTMCIQVFFMTLGLLLLTALNVGLVVKEVPHPLLVLICLPILPVISGGGVLLLAWCDTTNYTVRSGPLG
uniref:Uncharacterized protein n=1 Tax=Avena sativa TaxID=4498 RepID=A0ACD5WL43_AVESA